MTPPGPPKIAEALVSALLPPACREDVLGDLQERYNSPGRYAVDALRTLPFLFVSRIRRTADPQLLLIQACAVYLAFTASAWVNDRPLLYGEWGLLRLALPALPAILGTVLEDSYAQPGPRLPLRLARGPALGALLAIALETLFRLTHSRLALPPLILFYGCPVGVLLCSAIRLSFTQQWRQL